MFANTKGGISKSVLSVHLAVWLYLRGHRVALLDTDKQGTSSKWTTEGDFGPTVCVAHSMEEIEAAMNALKKDHDFIVVDIPGSDSEANQTVAMLADVAILPLPPSGPDLWAVKDGLKWIKLSQKVRTKPSTTIVLTRTRKRSRKLTRYREKLSQTDIPVARTHIRELDCFGEAAEYRTHVLRPKAEQPNKFPDCKEGVADLDSLFTELLGEHLERIDKRQGREAIPASSIKEAANA